VKSEEGALPACNGAWYWLSIHGIAVFLSGAKDVDSFLGSSHRFASRHAHQGYGYIYGYFWLPEVREPHRPRRFA